MLNYRKYVQYFTEVIGTDQNSFANLQRHSRKINARNRSKAKGETIVYSAFF